MEIWKNIEKFSNLYQVSNYGRVRSLDRVDSWGRVRKGKVLKHSLDKRGYPCVRVSINDVKKSDRIHRLVATAFVKNPESKEQVNHKDGNKENNLYTNLEWSTNSENLQHSYDIGLRAHIKGSKAPSFKAPTQVYDLNMSFLYEVCGNDELKDNGFDFRLVSAVILGKRKSHKEHKFTRILNYTPIDGVTTLE